MSSSPVNRPAAPRTARAIARSELTGAILASARAQLAEVGPAQLSVRAVARELGMASSAVYRYFASRDELLTALIVTGYNELGDVTERAEAAVSDRSDYRRRWLTLAHTTRQWSRAHPHDYALLFGSPVPGYAAPSATVEPATRVTRLVVALLHDVHEAGAAPPALIETSEDLHRALSVMREFADAPLSDDLALRGLRAWSGLIGTLTLELFGHFANAIDDLDAYFDAMARQLSPV